MSEFFHFSHQTRQRISMFLVSAVAVFGVGGILMSSYFQSQNGAEVNGASDSISSTSSLAQSSSDSSQSTDTDSTPENEPELETAQTDPDTTAVLPSITLSEQYTNVSYPDLALNYPSSWTFATSTVPSLYDGLASREITLTKKDSTLTIFLELAVPRDCIAPPTALELQQQLKNGLARYYDPVDSVYYYGVAEGFVAPCSSAQHRLNSIIQSNQFQELMGENRVYAWVAIDLVTSNQDHINQADQIISALQTSVTR